MNIIPRVSRTGISITLIPLRSTFLLSAHPMCRLQVERSIWCPKLLVWWIKMIFSLLRYGFKKLKVQNTPKWALLFRTQHYTQICILVSQTEGYFTLEFEGPWHVIYKWCDWLRRRRCSKFTLYQIRRAHKIKEIFNKWKIHMAPSGFVSWSNGYLMNPFHPRSWMINLYATRIKLVL